MGRLLDSLLKGSHAYRVKREADGYMLIAAPECTEEFSDLVREIAEKAGEDFVVFPTSDGHHRYSQMFVMPIDDVRPGPR